MSQKKAVALMSNMLPSQPSFSIQEDITSLDNVDVLQTPGFSTSAVPDFMRRQPDLP